MCIRDRSNAAVQRWYLGEKSKMFYPEENRLEINQWLMAQMGLIGPMIGQHHQFHYYHQGKSEWGEERYFKITRKLYEDLEARLSVSDYLAGRNYSIADIATWSWIARHKRHDIGLENFKGLSRCCLLYTSPSPRDRTRSRMPSSA